MTAANGVLWLGLGGIACVMVAALFDRLYEHKRKKEAR